MSEKKTPEQTQATKQQEQQKAPEKKQPVGLEAVIKELNDVNNAFLMGGRFYLERQHEERVQRELRKYWAQYFEGGGF